MEPRQRSLGPEIRSAWGARLPVGQIRKQGGPRAQAFQGAQAPPPRKKAPPGCSRAGLIRRRLRPGSERAVNHRLTFHVRAAPTRANLLVIDRRETSGSDGHGPLRASFCACLRFPPHRGPRWAPIHQRKRKAPRKERLEWPARGGQK